MPKNKTVWRITAAAPKGKWVDPNSASSAAPALPLDSELPEVSHGGWAMSSFDLLSGIDISEDSDTVPADLYDELFPAPAPGERHRPG